MYFCVSFRENQTQSSGRKLDGRHFHSSSYNNWDVMHIKIIMKVKLCRIVLISNKWHYFYTGPCLSDHTRWFGSRKYHRNSLEVLFSLRNISQSDSILIGRKSLFFFNSHWFSCYTVHISVSPSISKFSENRNHAMYVFLYSTKPSALQVFNSSYYVIWVTNNLFSKKLSMC